MVHVPNLEPLMETPSTSSSAITSQQTGLLEPEIGHVRTQYHPHSHRAPKIQTFGEYMEDSPPLVTPEEEPWKPFRSRLDFEVAEVVLEAALNRSQTDRLIKLIHRAAECNDYDPFTLKNAGNLNEMWDHASVLRTKVGHLYPFI